MVADLDLDVCSALDEQYGRADKLVLANVTSEAGVLAAVDVACDFAETFTGAVNCAGITPAECINERNGVHQLESVQSAVEVNLVGQ